MQNPVVEKRSKHIDIKYHFLRTCVEEKKIRLFKILGTENPADLLMKNLGFIKFEKFHNNFYRLEFASPTYSTAKRSINMVPGVDA